MGRNRKIRASLEGLEWIIEEHKRKLALQRAQSIRDERLIAKWERDIAVFEDQRARLLRRLRRDW